MQTVRGNLIYTAFATAVFLGIQWIDGARDPQLLAFSGVFFYIFTFFMLRLVHRVLGIFMKNRPPRVRGGQARGRRGEEDRGPAIVPPTTERPEHVRRRRERRRRR